MRITETFKSNSDKERLEAVTKLMIQLENKKNESDKIKKPPKAG